MSYLLDTNVVSEVSKGVPNPKVMAWLDAQPGHLLHITSFTVGEVEQGIDKLPDGAKRRRLMAWWQESVDVTFAGRILPFAAEEARMWARLVSDLNKAGTTIPIVDTMIAAVCRVHGLVMVTRNVSDMGRCGVKLLNPWA